MSLFTLSILDFSKEPSSITYRGVNMTAANFDAQTTLRTTLHTATAALIRGNITKTQALAFSTRLTNQPPTDQLAQREDKALVRYEDTTSHKIYWLEIPTIKIEAGDFLGNSDEFDLTVTKWADWVTAFQAYHKSPTGGAADVIDAHFVGRNT